VSEPVDVPYMAEYYLLETRMYGYPERVFAPGDEVRRRSGGTASVPVLVTYTVDEVHWLARNTDAVVDAERLELSASSTVRDTARLRDRYGDKARALSELVTARRAALRGGKVPDDWLVCGESAQQATPAVVAAERADFLADVLGGGSGGDGFGPVVADVTCSVGTELLHLSRRFGTVLGADLDPARLLMAQYNLRTSGISAAHVGLVRADAVVPAFAPGRVDVVVADPARRTSRGRIRDPKDLLPPLPDLVSAHAGGTGTPLTLPALSIPHRRLPLWR
jgi:hypothetical protein